MPKRVGIVGLGGMGRRHCAAVAAIPGAQLVAVCDRHDNIVSQVMAEWQVANGYQSWEEMLSNEALDALIVATNGPSHAKIVLAAVNAGIVRILCEKPMTVSLNSAEQIVSACKSRGVRLAVNHIRRWTPTYVQLKGLLQGRIIGDIRHIMFEMGGGQLASNGGHFWDLVCFLTGQEPKKVMGVLDKTGTPNPRGTQYSDPGAYGMVWLSGNTKVFFNMSEDYGTPPFVEILGSIGRIVIDERMGRYEIWTRKPEDRDKPMTQRPDLVQVPFEGQPVDMIDCVKRAISELLGDEPVSCTGEDGLRSLEISVAVHYSDESNNQIVTLPVPEMYRSKNYMFT